MWERGKLQTKRKSRGFQGSNSCLGVGMESIEKEMTGGKYIITDGVAAFGGGRLGALAGVE